MGEKGEGLTGTITKDTWTITRGGGNREGRWGWLGWWWGGKGRKLYLNNIKKKKNVKTCKKILSYRKLFL